MRKIRKTYSKPRKPWDKERIEEEKRLLKKYGLRRKREIWKAEALLRSFRQRARKLYINNIKSVEDLRKVNLNILGKIVGLSTATSIKKQLSDDD